MGDRDLADLMRGVAADQAPDVERLVAGGVSRGRRKRRRRQVVTTVAVAAAAVAVTVGTATVPALLSNERSAPEYADQGDAAPDASSDATDKASPAPSPTPRDARRPPDRPITISAQDIPGVVGEIVGEGKVGEGKVGEILQDGSFPLADEPQTKIVHFLYDGTLTTVSIERADGLAPCQALARGDDGTTCEVVDGLLTLTTPVATADGVSAQDVWVWNHGWIVSALSYNAPEGKDVEPVTDVPPLDEEELRAIATSERWFGA